VMHCTKPEKMVVIRPWSISSNIPMHAGFFMNESVQRGCSIVQRGVMHVKGQEQYKNAKTVQTCIIHPPLLVEYETSSALTTCRQYKCIMILMPDRCRVFMLF
jgi:hypothetical protein